VKAVTLKLGMHIEQFVVPRFGQNTVRFSTIFCSISRYTDRPSATLYA